MSSSRWLKRTPQPKIFENSGQCGLTKPPKADSVSFDSPKLGKFPKIDEPDRGCSHIVRAVLPTHYIARTTRATYECETCRLVDISEEVARRAQ